MIGCRGYGDSVDESDACDDHWQLSFALQATPSFGGGHDQFEDHETGRLVRQRALGAYGPVPHRGESACRSHPYLWARPSLVAHKMHGLELQVASRKGKAARVANLCLQCQGLAEPRDANRQEGPGKLREFCRSLAPALAKGKGERARQSGKARVGCLAALSADGRIRRPLWSMYFHVISHGMRTPFKG